MRVVWVGDSPHLPTGFARVSERVCRFLWERGHDVQVLGLGYTGAIPLDFPYRVHPLPANATWELKVYLDRLRPDVLWLFNDVWVIRRWREALGGIPVPTVVYTPVDGQGYGWHDEWQAALHHAQVYTYTEFGRRELTDLGVSVGVLPHGCDDVVFSPGPPERQRFGLPEDAFIVLNANRNQPRKRIDITIQGFCQFAAQVGPDAPVYLWLHMGIKDWGWHLPSTFAYWADYYGLAKRQYLFLTHDRVEHPCVSVDTLAAIYRSVDVVVNTSLGEGWGLTVHEAAMCGKPVVVPNNSASAELWDGWGLLIDCEGKYHDPGNGLVYDIPQASSLAAHLYWLYLHPEERQVLGHRARERALAFSWDKVLPGFEQALVGALAEVAA